jgi:hypothetical protein
MWRHGDAMIGGFCWGKNIIFSGCFRDFSKV